MKEEWRAIPNFEKRYEVSNMGQIRSVDYVDSMGRRRTSCVLKPSKNKQGYMKVVLTLNGNRYTRLVHRLVAAAFISNPFNLPMINHKDEKKANNLVENLEWCDSTYNNNYGTSNYRQARTKGKKVAQYSPDGRFIADYYSLSEAARRTGFSQGAIYNGVSTGRATNGYYWKPTEEVKVYA